jgi:hypothetical protein
VIVAVVRWKRLQTICASFASDWSLSLLDAASPFFTAEANLGFSSWPLEPQGEVMTLGTD